jgi:hypothetical protein
MMFRDWELIVIPLVAIALLVAGMMVHRAFTKAGKFDALTVEMQKQQEAFGTYVRLDNERDARRDAASQGYQNELKILRDQPRTVPVVRLCQPAAGHSVPAPADAPAGPESAAAAAGVLPGRTGQDTQGRDIGPALASLMDRADLLSAQFRAVLVLTGD